ncbi:hypothetical protein C7B61_15810 [filamentous cyanobacterium CCP1]|nr:hypothetical protein C7B76_04035 [filamentous cyanobacterium CCP2]PSB61521.1 hypothetical protein C7B61_15810 [filamentous cyanobacterium CCP1]
MKTFAVSFTLKLILLALPIAASALPPPEDVPEEVLRTEIITEARSPINGESLTASEYAELEEELQRQPDLHSNVSQDVRSLIHLLYVRRTLRFFIPFIP